MRHNGRGESVPGEALTLRDIGEGMRALVQAKGWDRDPSSRPQTPRNLATSIALEAAELLECFQWSDRADCDRVADELADVVLYTCRLAAVADIDLSAAIKRKMAINMGRVWDLQDRSGASS